jgi:hypothetical protein
MGIAGVSAAYATAFNYADYAAGRRTQADAAASASGLPPTDPDGAEPTPAGRADVQGSGAARKSTDTKSGLGSKTELTEEQLAQLSKLQSRDLEVRQHEMAHLAASGGLATSGASFTYQKGPDGVSYAIGGEVSIDTSPGRTPEDTIQRAQSIQRAALAPADPSGQDRAVAAAAQQMELQARAQMAAQPAQSGGKGGVNQGGGSVTAVRTGSGGTAAPEPQQFTQGLAGGGQNQRQASQLAQAYGAGGAGAGAGGARINLYV